MGLLDTIWAQYLKLPKSELDISLERPYETQWKQLQKIISNCSNTEWGIKYNIDQVLSYEQWEKNVPIIEYDEIKDAIHRMMKGEENVLWPGRVYNFAKSSGTTSDKSKYIPIPSENHKECHTKGGLRLMANLYHTIEKPGILDGKTILLVGSVQSNHQLYPNSMIGDVSAVIYKNLSSVLKTFLVPEESYNLLEDSERKLDIIAEKSSHEDVKVIAGSPTWILLLCKKMLALTGKKNMLEVWPHFRIMVHGAVSFVPYRKTFEELFPSPNVHFVETYNASEGYFAFQDKLNSDELLLLLDVGVFYEFISLEELDKPNPKCISLIDVELNKKYAMVITTNSGLYRYKIGDTVQFTSIIPHRIKITGRIKQFINVFGEELMVSNTDEALRISCNHYNIKLKDYTVAPVFQTNEQKGGHEWIIEFESSLTDQEGFTEYLDKTLQSLNSDYEAKRFKNLAMARLKLNVARANCFNDWMKATNRIGAQKKVPRLANHRSYLEEILEFAK